MIFRVFGRIVGRFFRGIGRLLLGFFRFISRHETALGIGVVVVLLVGGIFLLLSVLDVNIVLGQPPTVAAPTSLVSPTVKASTPTPAPPQPQVSLTNAPAAAETFLQGQIYFNADKVWNSLSASLRTSLQGQGEDQKYFDQVFQDLKSKGRQYLGYQFVGAYKGTDQQTVCFYVIRYRESDKDIEQPYTFWLDAEGKITQFSVS